MANSRVGVKFGLGNFSSSDVLYIGMILFSFGVLIFASEALDPNYAFDTHSELAFLSVVVAGFLLIACCRARQLAVPEEIQKGRRESKSNDETKRGAEELFVYLFLSSLFLVACSVQTNSFANIWPWTMDFSSSLGVVVLCVCMAVSWVPLLYLFHLNSRQAHGNYLLHPEGPVPYQSIAVTAGIIALIYFGARQAADAATSGQSMGGNFGLFILAFVVAVFVLFIMFPHIGAWWHAWLKRRRKLEGVAPQSFAALVRPDHLLSSFDAFLVRVISPVTGVTQSGSATPKLILISIFLPLTLLAYFLPAPLGLLPIAVAGLLIVSLHRRWAWVESDRDKSLRISSRSKSNFRVGFKNDDMRDEALTGYVFLFALIPLALRQIQLAYTPFVPIPEHGGDAEAIGSWLTFFGAELAKGVPIVDWIDIYKVDEQPLFRTRDGEALGLHLIFAARLIVDLVLLAALFQAINIWRRTEAQQKLFDEGQVEFFDPFVEKRLFRQAFVPKSQRVPPECMPVSEDFYDRLKSHRDAAERNGGSSSLYSHNRLNDMALDSSRKQIKEIAIWIAEKDEVLVGRTEVQLESLLNSWPAISEDSPWETDHEWRRKQRHTLETLLATVDNDPDHYWSEKMSETLSRLLSHVYLEKDFDSVRQTAYNVLASSTRFHALKAIAARLVRIEDVERLPHIGTATAEKYAFCRQPHQADRTVAASALIKYNMNFRDSRPNGSYGQTGEFLDALIKYILTDEGRKVHKVITRAGL